MICANAPKVASHGSLKSMELIMIEKLYKKAVRENPLRRKVDKTIHSTSVKGEGVQVVVMLRLALDEPPDMQEVVY